MVIISLEAILADFLLPRQIGQRFAKLERILDGQCPAIEFGRDGIILKPGLDKGKHG